MEAMKVARQVGKVCNNNNGSHQLRKAEMSRCKRQGPVLKHALRKLEPLDRILPPNLRSGTLKQNPHTLVLNTDKPVGVCTSLPSYLTVASCYIVIPVGYVDMYTCTHVLLHG